MVLVVALAAVALAEVFAAEPLAGSAAVASGLLRSARASLAAQVSLAAPVSVAQVSSAAQAFGEVAQVSLLAQPGEVDQASGEAVRASGEVVQASGVLAVLVLEGLSSALASASPDFTQQRIPPRVGQWCQRLSVGNKSGRAAAMISMARAGEFERLTSRRRWSLSVRS